MFSCSRNVHVTFMDKPQLKIIIFQNYALSGKAFNGTVMN